VESHARTADKKRRPRVQTEQIGGKQVACRNDFTFISCCFFLRRVTLDILTLMALATGNMMVTFSDSESFYAVQKWQRRIPKFWLPGHLVTAQRSMRRVMRCNGGDAGACDDRGHCNDVGNPSILIMIMLMMMMMMMLMMTMMTITMMMMFTMIMMTQVHNSLSEIRHFPSF
jgi:hypothetical protein